MSSKMADIQKALEQTTSGRTSAPLTVVEASPANQPSV